MGRSVISKERIYKFNTSSRFSGTPLFYPPVAAKPTEAQKTHPATVSPLVTESPLVLSGSRRLYTDLPAVHVHVHSRVAKELCGAQGPTGRSPVEFL